MNRFLVAVGSQFGNGKNVLIDYLYSKLNQNYKCQWKIGSFASNVKRIFCETFGVPLEFVEEWKRRDGCPPGFMMPVRNCLTFIGDGFRDINQDIWVNLLLDNNDDNLLISDLRYVSEAEHIRDRNGVTILLYRPGHENDFPNRSEQELMPFVNRLKYGGDTVIEDQDIPFDLFIKNDGDLNCLYDKIDNIVVPYLAKKWNLSNLS